MKRLTILVLLAMVSMGLKAQDAQVKVLFSDFTGGTVETKAIEGQEVTITVTPAEGYQIEKSDSVKTYLLQVTDKHLRGEQMPIEYARPEIEKIVLSTRQVEFLQKERERLYNEAIQKGTIKFYE